MHLLSNVNFNQKDIKVKTYIRKGKVVKAHNKKIDVRSALIGGSIGALGVGALTGAYFLGKRGTVPKQQIEDIKALLQQKHTINVQAPNVTITQAAASTSVSNPAKEIAREVGQSLQIRKINLPAKASKPSAETLERMTKQARAMSNEKLEKEILKHSKTLAKYQDTLFDINQATRLQQLTGKLADINAGKTTNSSRQYLEKEVSELADYFKLPKQNPNELKLEYTPDSDYIKKVRTLSNRSKSFLDIHQRELNSRQAQREIGVVSNEDIDRLQGLMDDFRDGANLTLFNISNSQSMTRIYLLSDIAEFGRTIGANNKKYKK